MKKHRKITAAVVAVIMCMSCTGFSNISNIRFNDNVIIANAEDGVWDGTDDTSWYDGEEKELYISTAEELAGLSTIVNKGNSMDGQTIVLGSDIYLNSLVDMDKWSENPPELTWTSIGTIECPFKANFKGNGHIQVLFVVIARIQLLRIVLTITPLAVLVQLNPAVMIVMKEIMVVEYVVIRVILFLKIVRILAMERCLHN